MTSYFLFYLVLFMVALWNSSEFSYEQNIKFSEQKKRLSSWFLIALTLTLFIGYRHQVGGDWGAYLRHFNAIDYYSIGQILTRSDPGYYLINWLMSDWGFDIYAVNIICGALFTAGLIIFSRQQPNFWLAIAVAFPYLIVVIAMGYTRQGVALGFVFWGLASLDQKKFKQFIVLVALAATFHKSAVLMIGLGLFLQGNGKMMRFIAVLIVGIGIWNAFLAQYQERLWNTYVTAQIQSQGAFIRVVMNMLPAIIFLIYRREWKRQFNDYPFWFMIALGSLMSLILVNFASTAVDRIALYFTPIQVTVYSRLPYLLKGRFNTHLVTFSILCFYLLVLFVWLNYATHSIYWLPYDSVLFGDTV